MNRSWTDLTRKVKAALGAALALNGATVIALIADEISVRTAVVAILTADFPVLAAYLTSSSADDGE